jgi:hypothetical protein
MKTHCFEEETMSYVPDMAADPWNLQARIPRTISILTDDSTTVRQVVWDRLRQDPSDRLPRMERSEFPADIFVDTVSAVKGTESQYIAQSVRKACADLLAEQVRALDFTDLSALGELIYLAARVESGAAVKPLTELLAHPQARRYFRSSETLSERTMRALVGILVSHPNLVTEEHRQRFRDVLFEPSCTELALVGLIGFFHESREQLLNEVRLKELKVNDKVLNAHLRIAGFSAQ